MFVLKCAKRLPVIAAAAVLLAGCASAPAPVANYSFGGNAPPTATTAPVPATASSSTAAQTFGLGSHANGSMSAAGYVVAPGDTLYSIAFANGMDVRQLAALNGIASPYVIHPGQVLKLKAAVASSGAASTALASSAQPPSTPVFGPVTTQPMAANGVKLAASASVVSTPVPSVPAASVAPPPPPAGVPTPPAGATRSVAGITWEWPANGKVIGGFKAGSGGDGAGLDIAGEMGEPVRAAAAGKVVYSGNGLRGFGQLIIIKHNDSYISAYGHNSKRLVKEGAQVSAGQEIALMGASAAPRVELHFEIRKDGKPVDPLSYLPKR